ncbi:MAG: holo-ACP synthase [Candidatus Omnitrophota bacterium]
MSIAGIGIDTVCIERFKKTVDRYGDLFLKKVFTNKEQEYAGTKKSFFMHMAGKFAAKEAVKKALPEGARVGLTWPDIEILNDKLGKPYAVLHGSAEQLMKEFDLKEVLVSISHTEDLATSNAVAVNNGS